MTYRVIGFTGTDKGMTDAQLHAVLAILQAFRGQGASEARHGMCVGADAEFDESAHVLGYDIIGHPGVTKDGRVWKRAAQLRCRVVLPARPFLKRNRDIVSVSDVLVATPLEAQEQQRSGPWATVRYARQACKTIFLVLPDGEIVVETPAVH